MFPQLRFLTHHLRRLAMFGIIGAVVAGIFTALFPLYYRADAQVLIITRSRLSADPYTIVKSAERVGESIALVLTSHDFYTKVIRQPGFTIDTQWFEQGSEKKRRKRWEKTIRASVVYGTGILNVSAYSTNRDQAKAIAGSAVSALVNESGEYTSGDLNFKVLNDPLVTRFPVRPNVAVNMLLGAIVAVLLKGMLLMRRTAS